MPIRILGPEGGGFSGDPISIGERVDCDVPHWLERRTKQPL